MQVGCQLSFHHISGAIGKRRRPVRTSGRVSHSKIAHRRVLGGRGSETRSACVASDGSRAKAEPRPGSHDRPTSGQWRSNRRPTIASRRLLLVRLRAFPRLRQPRGQDPDELSRRLRPHLGSRVRQVVLHGECDRPRWWAAAFSDPVVRTAATTVSSRSVATSAGPRGTALRDLTPAPSPRPATRPGPRSGSRRLLTRAQHLSGAPEQMFYFVRRVSVRRGGWRETNPSPCLPRAITAPTGLRSRSRHRLGDRGSPVGAIARGRRDVLQSAVGCAA